MQRITKQKRKANKEHECMCGRKICSGEVYERVAYLIDGEISVDKVGDHVHSWNEPEKDDCGCSECDCSGCEKYDFCYEFEDRDEYSPENMECYFCGDVECYGECVEDQSQ